MADKIAQETCLHIQDLTVYISQGTFAEGMLTTRAVAGKVLIRFGNDLSVSLPPDAARGLIECIQGALAEIDRQ